MNSPTAPTGSVQSASIPTRFVRRLRRLLGRALRALTTTAAERRHALVGPARLWEMKRRFQVDFLTRVGLRPDHYLLDVGCGTLRGGIPLIERLEPRHYYGIEIREDVLEEGRRELREAKLEAKEPTLVHYQDASTLDLGRQFDLVWAFSVLIHLTDDVLDSCLGMVARHLESGGRFFANVNIGNAASGTWRGFPVVTRSLAFYAEAARRHGLEVSDLGPLRDLGHVSGEARADAQRMLEFRATSAADTDAQRVD